MVEKKLLYALDEKDNLVSIDEVKNGLDCNCICPSCKAKLVARNNGEIREHHFAHYKNSSCATGYQTSLHLLAKELINEKKMIKIPPVPCDIFYEDPYRYKSYFFKNEEIEKEKLLENVNVYLETKENGIIPDIIVQYGDYDLYVEIYVTHKVDDIKRQLVKEKGIDMIEIDLSKEDRLISKEELSKYIFEKTSKSIWINNKIQNIRNVKEQNKEKDFIKNLELEEKRENEKNQVLKKQIQETEFRENIKKGICPKCHTPFVRYINAYGWYSIVCSEDCHYYNSLPNESKIIIQKRLENTHVFNFQEKRVHDGKCPRPKCGCNLVVRTGPYGPFITCCKYKCNPTINDDLKKFLPEYLQKKFHNLLEEKR